MSGDFPMLAFAVFVVLAAGMAVFYAVVREPRRYFRVERFAYAWPLGMAALGLPMFLMSLAGMRLSVVAISAVVAAGWLVAWACRRTPLREYWTARDTVEATHVSLTEFEWVLVFIILGCLGTRAVACLLTPMVDWDGIATWGLKAKILYFGTLQDSGDYFHNAEYRCTNQAYPLLCPLLYAWVCTVLGRWDDLRMFIINPIHFTAFIGLVYFTLRKLTSRRSALVVTAIAVSLPSTMHYVECAQSDVPLMLLSGAATFCLVDWMRHRRVESVLLAGILMGGAMFAKEEGRGMFAAQMCAIALAAWFGADRKRSLRDVAIFFGIGCVLILPWSLFHRTIPPWYQYFNPLGFHTLRWSQIGGWCKTVWDNATHFYNGAGLPKWNFLWPILAVLVLLSRSPRRSPWNYILLISILHAMAISVVWLCSTIEFTPGNNEFAYERNTLILLPPLWIVLAACVEEWWAAWRSNQSSPV